MQHENCVLFSPIMQIQTLGGLAHPSVISPQIYLINKV